MGCRCLCFLLAVLLLSCGSGEGNGIRAEPEATSQPRVAEIPPVLRPGVAGSFYPADAKKLRDDIGRYFESADVPDIDGEIVAVIVPHAGYVYSGPVAAYAYKAIARQSESQKPGLDKKPDAVVVLAFDHRGRNPGVSVYYRGAVETPLGQVLVHEGIARELMESDGRISFTDTVFAGEHSAEVQMPFIQVALPGVPVVPVLFGWQALENIEAVSRGLQKIAREHDILVVASTDLSHYNPYERANSLDAETVKIMLECDPERMTHYVSQHNDRMCGPGPVLVALAFAKSQGASPVLLKYANSGDTSGNKAGVVGYVALAFLKNDVEQPSSGKAASVDISKKDVEETASYVLTDDDKRFLLQLARRSLESYVRDRKMLDVEPPANPILRENGAAFVTLNTDGRLRGCIGSMRAIAPLYKTVIEMAVAAASQDPRFKRVRPEELSDIHIEISVNTPLRPVSGPDEIELGKHGVVVSKGMRQGVYLPQVATETGWTKEQFLSSLCAHKAGLAPDAYKKDAKLYVFTSIVFGEE